jgi:hypothetical protein
VGVAGVSESRMWMVVGWAATSMLPWDHNAHHHRWILRQLPRRFNRAPDIGSGSGDLARLLADVPLS